MSVVMSMRIVIPIKPISWNRLAAKNRWVYKSIKDEWQKATFDAVMEQWDGQTPETPCRIRIEAHWKQKRLHDITDLYAKAVIDAIVKMKIIPDDSLQYVKEITVTGKVGCMNDEMIIEFFDLSFDS